ncbi:hypothetical protein NCU10457 [Neurospora crassa OR74A]|uniref:Uncharacterized protein n=1 Tax=Neurospora crassa (strain ATCC 24698 / 74-OR23-1A / CBS 708.71 / DSM 1257 / FGSC 987) TaxID=367110 RepID=A7UWE2_NEUCR|nr:hypothetical protein NCU10457 [Neurospora crassa OR74A]EDO65232.1 hypothetical protein NCU10457 [Neurospora crassa OR74A]|eukprot:XP_001728323.1 hypothetical protein NCU10457 [Neurospora crassa OR74A]
MHALLVHEAEQDDHPLLVLSRCVHAHQWIEVVGSQCDQTTEQAITEENPYDQNRGGNQIMKHQTPKQLSLLAPADAASTGHQHLHIEVQLFTTLTIPVHVQGPAQHPITTSTTPTTSGKKTHTTTTTPDPTTAAHTPNPPSTSRRPSLNLATLKSSPKTASLLKAASRALEAGAATALKLRKDSPSTPLFSAQSGSKIAAAALGAAVVDGLIEHEQRRHPKLMRKGGLRHHVVKQVVQRGVAGLVGGILEEGLAGGGGGDEKGEGRQKGGRSGRKESVKRVAKGMVRDYDKWEKGNADGGKGTGGKKEKAGKSSERGRRASREERERDTSVEERRRERTRERGRGREEIVRGRRR